MVIEEMFDLFSKKWALVSAGEADSFNTMTVAWGSLGTLWSRPVATIYIKPARYTYKFLNAHDYFSISFFEEAYRDDLNYLGHHSGRDEDKLAKTELTAQFVSQVPTFKQASITLLCHKIYYQDLDVAKMPKAIVEHYYASDLPHRMYVGEIVKIIKKDNN